MTLRTVLSGEDAFEKDLSKSPTLGRGKQGSKMDMMMMMMKKKILPTDHSLFDSQVRGKKDISKAGLAHDVSIISRKQEVHPIIS